MLAPLHDAEPPHVAFPGASPLVTQRFALRRPRAACRPAATFVTVALGMCLAAWPLAAQAAVIFVRPDGDDTHDGLSWDNAKQTVTGGLDAATDGDQIWVGAGTYVERITLKIGVALYGGLAGSEDPATFDLDDRDFAANEAIVDGDQGGSVVTGPSGATESCRIDGFTITGGTGTETQYAGMCGGGLYLFDSSPTIANSTIAGNSASDGGGLGDGGGLYLYNSSPTIVNNTITGNSADVFGGGLCLIHSDPRIASNTIARNSAYSGGGLCLHVCHPTIENNTITDNSASDGGGLYVSSSSPTIANNTISDNSADFAGGGLCLCNSFSMIANNTITGNSAPDGDGGGIYLFYYSSPTIANNTITNNSSYYGGGGLYLLGSSSPKINNNVIMGNSAYSGGGLELDGSSPTIVSNMITGNSADSDGGGLYLLESSPTIENNRIAANSAEVEGGGLFLDDSSPTIANNTITGNTSSSDGGGVYLWSSSPTMSNTIVALNSSGIYRSANGDLTLRYNCVYDNDAYNYSGIDDPTGINGNISADPQFVDAVHDNYHLQPDSPCIDAGDNTSVPADTVDLDGDGDTAEPIPFDFDGLPRFIDDPDISDTGNGTPPIVDMGAYEYQGSPIRRADVNCDGSVDFNDIDPFVTALISRDEYESQYPDCKYLNSDINQDGSVDFNDIDGFVECLINGGCP